MSFFGELRRRNVFKVGAAYAIVAWLLIQVAATLLPVFGAPEWVLPAFSSLIILGFPLAVVFAWAFEITPDGFRKTLSVAPDESITEVTGRKLNFAIIGLLVAAVLFMFVDNYVLDEPSDPRLADDTEQTASGRGTEAALPKVAVLPCDNLSANSADAYFASGIHEEILNQLVKLNGLLVVSRTTVLQYAENRPPIPQIAEALDAQAIMECSVRYSGDSILVTAQLIDPITDAHIFSETYPGDLSDTSAVFAMQADIAMNIANALNAEYSTAEQARLEQVSTESVEAYALYLRALEVFDNGSVSALIALLDEAIAEDPGFADAYALKGSGYAFSMVNTTGGAAVEADWIDLAARATEYAELALSMDSNAVRAYEALAAVSQFQWRWDEALEHWEQALRLAPNDIEILWQSGWFKAFRGDYDEAIRHAEREVELAPLDGRSYLNLAVAHEYAGNVEAAIAAHRDCLAILPSQLLSRQHLGLLEARQGNAAAAVSEFEFIERFFGGEPQIAFLPELAIGYAMSGRPTDAARLADDIFELAEQRDVGIGSLAMAYLAIGDLDNALAQLELAAQKVENNQPDQGFFSLMLIRHNVIGHPVLEEPRFRAVRQAIGRT